MSWIVEKHIGKLLSEVLKTIVYTLMWKHVIVVLREQLFYTRVPRCGASGLVGLVIGWVESWMRDRVIVQDKRFWICAGGMILMKFVHSHRLKYAFL